VKQGADVIIHNRFCHTLRVPSLLQQVTGNVQDYHKHRASSIDFVQHLLKQKDPKVFLPLQICSCFALISIFIA